MSGAGWLTLTTMGRTLSSRHSLGLWSSGKNEHRVVLNQVYVIVATLQVSVVRKVDNAIHRINQYPADSVVCFVNTFPLDSDLSSG